MENFEAEGIEDTFGKGPFGPPRLPRHVSRGGEVRGGVAAPSARRARSALLTRGGLFWEYSRPRGGD